MEIEFKISALLGFKFWQEQVTSRYAIKFIAFGIIDSAFLNRHIKVLNSHIKHLNETKRNI